MKPLRIPRARRFPLHPYPKPRPKIAVLFDFNPNSAVRALRDLRLSDE